jgi:hypothetical protein
MASTHRLKNNANYAEGGYWNDEYGDTICEWEWDLNSRILTVHCGFHGRKRDLSGFGVGQFTEETLKERLPRLALEIAEDLRDRECLVLPGC